MAFFFTHVDHLAMPRTTNIIEGIIRQLRRKIDDAQGFNSVGHAWRSLKLLIMRYRFERFRDSRFEGHNCTALLGLAALNVDGIDRSRFSKKNQHKWDTLPKRSTTT
jgi:hypothetical protein